MKKNKGKHTTALQVIPLFGMVYYKYTELNKPLSTEQRAKVCSTPLKHF